jgi:hypothetical protein
MNTPKEEQEPAFKVVDRRRFDEEGKEKSCCDHDHHEHEQRFVKNEAEPKVEESKKTMALNFSFFIQSLAHQAMMGLGLVPWPDSNLIKPDRNLAKETIDLLQILKTKTTGNLDKDEQALLDTLLYQLQVAYVEMIK